MIPEFQPYVAACDLFSGGFFIFIMLKPVIEIVLIMVLITSQFSANDDALLFTYIIEYTECTK